ncbi:ferrous iron transport protein A [Martelella lutilitoris]|uniref:Ferrous iron transport protein A n=1 Tax=Martelella lutilitoris TaxID=2583532 RepID=A0A7T7HKC4_9HYPH|nr:FeoA family protein [Martelella lutilitoris]MAM12276.1 ferrous iron transport protein A [Rhizobiaceae bacterium]QQM30775.1 ferrous iron transport protein A [Martelella lutilitoris]
MTSEELQVGARIRVTGYHRGERAGRQRLLAMGITPGTDFLVTRIAPFGDPVEIRIRDFSLSLRRAELSAFRGERVPS